MKKLITFYIFFFLGSVGFSTQMPIIPLYASSLGSGISETGIIVSLMFYMAAFLMIPFGMLSDRVGARKIMIAGLSIYAIAPILYTFAGTPLQIVFVRIFHGLGVAMYIPSALSFVVGLAPAEKRGEATGWVITAGQMGLMCGPLAGGFLLDLFNFKVSFYGIFFITLIGLIMAIASYKHTPQKADNKSSDTAQRSWGWLKQILIFAALLIPLLMALGSGNLNAYIPLYGIRNAISVSEIGAIIAIYYASSSILRVPFGKLTDRYGPRLIILIGFFIFAVGMALFSLAHSFLSLSLVAVLFGLGFGIGFPAAMVIVANQAPPHMRGMAMAMYTATFQIGIALGTMLMGFVADATSFETMFQISGIVMLLGVFTFYLLTRNKPQLHATPTN